MPAFGVLAGLLCHIYAGPFSRPPRRLARGTGRRAVIGLFSKESAIVLLAAMVLYDLVFPGWRSRRLPGMPPSGLALALFFAVRQSVLSKLPSGDIPFADNPLIAADFLDRALHRGQSDRQVPRAPRLARANLSCDYSYNQIPLSTWSDWPTWAAVAVCLALAAAAIFCYRRRPRR